MIAYFKEFNESASEKISVFLVPFGAIITIINCSWFKGMEILTHQSLFKEFPVASFVWLSVNVSLWGLFIASCLTMKENNWKYFPITMGTFVGVAFPFIYLLLESTNNVRKISYSSNELFTLAIGSLLLAALPVIAWCLDQKQTLQMALEKEKEDNKHTVQEDLTLHLRNYRDMLNMDIRNEVSNVYYLYERLKRESLSIEEYHILSRSKKEFHKVLDEYMELHYKSQKEIQPTILAILNDIKQEAQCIFDKKEEEKMNDIKRVLTLRKEKTTY